MGLFDLFRKKETALDGGQQKWNRLWALWENGRAEETLEQCDDFFYAHETTINAALQAYADTLRP